MQSIAQIWSKGERMTSVTSNIRHTFNGKCFIKGVLMQMTVRMTLKLKGSRSKKT